MPAGDPGALAGALAQVLTDPIARRAATANGASGSPASPTLARRSPAGTPGAPLRRANARSSVGSSLRGCSEPTKSTYGSASGRGPGAGRKRSWSTPIGTTATSSAGTPSRPTTSSPTTREGTMTAAACRAASASSPTPTRSRRFSGAMFVVAPVASVKRMRSWTVTTYGPRRASAWRSVWWCVRCGTASSARSVRANATSWASARAPARLSAGVPKRSDERRLTSVASSSTGSRAASWRP